MKLLCNYDHIGAVFLLFHPFLHGRCCVAEIEHFASWRVIDTLEIDDRRRFDISSDSYFPLVPLCVRRVPDSMNHSDTGVAFLFLFQV